MVPIFDPQPYGCVVGTAKGHPYSKPRRQVAAGYAHSEKPTRKTHSLYLNFDDTWLENTLTKGASLGNYTSGIAIGQGSLNPEAFLRSITNGLVSSDFYTKGSLLPRGSHRQLFGILQPGLAFTSNETLVDSGDDAL